MKALPAAVALLFLGAGALPAQAKDQAKPANNATAELKRGLDAMMSSVTAAGQPSTADRDQGDDHASDRAIQQVCSKDTPAAERSAICPRPVSP